MITSATLRAAPRSAAVDGLQRVGHGWVTSGAWMVRRKLCRLRVKGFIDTPRADLALTTLDNPRSAAKEVRRGFDRERPCRVYTARGGRAVLFEEMAVLLDGLKVVRLGSAWSSPLAGIGPDGAIQVVVMPTNIKPSELTTVAEATL